MTTTKPDGLLVLDFGGQYSHLIARRIRALNVYSELAPPNLNRDGLEEFRERMTVKGLILSGGPRSIYQEDAPTAQLEEISALPLLGICYGHQLIAHNAGGTVEGGRRQEYGLVQATILDEDDVFVGLDSEQEVWMSHGDLVKEMPEDYEVLARTDTCPVAAFRHSEEPIFGIQWHPEVTHTTQGQRILENFALSICECTPTWTPGALVSQLEEEIREEVGEKKALVAVSGGVDSTTAAILGHRALGERLTSVFVDHGLCRTGERESVSSALRSQGLDPVIVEGKKRFLGRLEGMVDPEEKRQTIGEEFIRVFEEVARDRGIDVLIQGTIYPDRIESGFGQFADRIKSHHNVAGIPARVEFAEIVEPLNDLYKDEVRELARDLGLHDVLTRRQPFPGPGLAVRIVGEVTEEKLSVLRKSDRIVSEELEKTEWVDGLWQYFAVLTDTMSTGVRGDARSYGYTVAIRAVQSVDGMTANFFEVPYSVLGEISRRITNEIPSVTRVVYDVTDKPPATIEWE
jgi:GMP synthase (glutamine-hydrolysing)